MCKLPPLMNKGRLKLASEIKYGDFIILNDSLFDVGKVVKIIGESRLEITTQNGMTFYKKEFKPDHTFALYETYPNKG